mgnify:FL=1
MAGFNGALFSFVGGTAAAAFAGTTNGVPGPIFGMTSEQFKEMPSSMLRDMLDMLLDAEHKADEVEKEIKKKSQLEMGLLEFDDDKGDFQTLSDTSRYGLDRDEQQQAANLAGMIAGLMGFG